jgi:cytoskeletal protein CcmA (bactofilin family)
MFTKSKDATPESTTASAAAATSSAQPQTQQPAPAPQKRAGTRAAPSIISADLVVTGTLSSSGDMQIDGRVEGDVHSAALVIGEKATILGEVLADEVTVRGRIEGSIRARKVLLCATCHVEGNILHEAFAVEAGAFFEGNCRHSDNPLGDDIAKRNPAYERRPQGSASASPSPGTPTNGGAAIAAKALDVSQSRPIAAAIPKTA